MDFVNAFVLRHTGDLEDARRGDKDQSVGGQAAPAVI